MATYHSGKDEKTFIDTLEQILKNKELKEFEIKEDYINKEITIKIKGE